jgi:hypothetical protein
MFRLIRADGEIGVYNCRSEERLAEAHSHVSFSGGVEKKTLGGEAGRKISEHCPRTALVAECCRAPNGLLGAANANLLQTKKQGTTGITTVVPYVAGQWGRGNNRLPE